LTASNPKPVRFELIRQDRATAARLGRVSTPHGLFDTPAFMPVGTQGSIKGILPDHVEKTGTQIVLANTYHLMLRPGEKSVAALGGLHRFMGWRGPILTDSGGFQVFSLADLNEVSDIGVKFKSHIDGSEIFLDARRSIEVQNDLGADIIMAFDQCPPAAASAEAHRRAVMRTLTWGEQCLAAHGRPRDQALFAIVQGGVDLKLRHECARELSAMDFAGYAIGGLAVGEGFDGMKAVLDEITPSLPGDKPRYLMGVGYPRDIVAGVAAGVDMFDCVLPTRNGRNAYAFTSTGPLRLRNSVHQRDISPIEAGCEC
jgi:queuine tRNA-ribosyltransferase